MSRKKLHIVTNTHWDREHRTGFQETRYALVEMIDKLIYIMENDPEFKCFIFDGQTLVLEDYLEVKPYMKDRLKALIESGRILVGPWCSLPDHFSLNPECIIRNLLRGDRVSREFGHKMNLGYSIFSFGQTAQLPQLYAGFGIDQIIFYKRFSPDIMRNAEFIWEAPDGTKALASHLGHGLRINFFFCFTIPVILGGDARKRGSWNVAFTGGTRLIHFIDNAFCSHYATELEQDTKIRKENIRKAVEDVLEDVSNSVAESVFMAFDGCDFTAPVKEIPAALKAANEIMGDEVELIHSNPVDYFKELREEIDTSKLITYKGEMRFGPVNSLQSEIMSTNIELKQRNHKAEVSILNYAEPFSVFNKVNDGIYPTDMLLKGWKYLFSVHPHDAIHGSGVSKMKSDNLDRLAQAQEIADGVARRAFEGLVSNIDTSSFDDNDIFITVFNPAKHERSEVVNLKIDLPREEFAAEYCVEDLDGRELEIYEYDRKDVNMASSNAENRPKNVLCERVDVDIVMKNIPALGYKTFKLKRVRGVKALKGNRPFANPVLPYKPIGKSPVILDNRLLRVKVNQNGTIDITNLETGFTYEGLNVFTDTGSSGDMWIHREPVNNKIITSHGCSADISLIRNSSLSATLKIDVFLNIPAGLTEDEKSRSCCAIPTKISTELTVTKGSKRVDFKVYFENKCKEHKLTVGFPTGLKTDFSRSQAPFEIRKQPIENMSNKKGKIGGEPQRHPMHDFIDISDGRNGIALFTKGLKEFETKYYDDGYAACELTLLRGVMQSFPIHEEVFVGFEEELSQCLGNHKFEYSLFFHNGDCFEGDVIAESANFILPMVAAQYGKGKKGELPAEVSFIKSSSRHTILNCIKKAEDNDEIILRITNPIEKPIKERLEFYNQIKWAFTTNLNEEKAEEIAVGKDNSLELKIPPYKIITLSLGVSLVRSSELS